VLECVCRRADHDTSLAACCGRSEPALETHPMRKLLIALLLLGAVAPIATGAIGCRAEGEVGDAD